ncbi:MAG: isoaspartyl peptidase/L-asparaginase [Proteobacteria bacterium]|nr:isoaspartyl peptidase/L-asparaginase [Pseudomonadota bacterium]
MKKIISSLVAFAAFFNINNAYALPASGDGYKSFEIGDSLKKAKKPPKAGILMAGGGEWPYEAFRWFADHTGNGHLVILRAPNSDATTEDMTGSAEEMYQKVGGFSAITTIAFFDRKAAFNPEIAKEIRNADGIFIAGGDQSRYVNYWRGTPVIDAINAHVKAGKPLGGTSAGLAVQGEYMYGAMDGGSITSPEALKDPLGKAVTIEGDFVKIPLLKGIVTDSHFKERNRQGRLAAFLAKSQKMAKKPLIGLGIDEQTALAVEGDGSAKLYSNINGFAWWFEAINPKNLNNGAPLVAENIKVTGISSNSTLDLKDKKIENPAFVREYSASNGEFIQKMKYSLAIHGGAGVIEPGDLTPELEKQYRKGLNDSLLAGQAVLEKGGSSLDAVEAAVRVLEDNPLFNAGKGAVFTAQGTNELDAAIMDGATQKAGAVAGVTRTRNPITLARAVMEKSGRLMLARDGADRFSIENGLQQVDPSYYYTEERWKQLQLWRAKKFSQIDQTHIFGTVGAVALDSNGNLAAATSTGGLTGKVFGRIGDTPIIGAGTIAINGYAAVSCTGTGEYFIRENAARQIVDRIRWNNQDIHTAAYDTIMAVGELGGDGGLIAMDKDGNAAFALNDVGMYRGFVSSTQAPMTSIYPKDTIKVEGRHAKTSKEMH